MHQAKPGGGREERDGLVRWLAGREVPAPSQASAEHGLPSASHAVPDAAGVPATQAPVAGSQEVTTVVALVAEDTLPILGGRPPNPRRYLVRLR